MAEDLKRVIIKWRAGEDPLEDGTVTVEDIQLGILQDAVITVETLMEALRKYGRHASLCKYEFPAPVHPNLRPECDCGWADVEKMLNA